MQFKQSFGLYNLYAINGEHLDYLGFDYIPSLTSLALKISTLSKKKQLSHLGSNLHDFVHGVGIET